MAPVEDKRESPEVFYETCLSQIPLQYLQVRRAALEASAGINAKRENRGLKPRPVRAVMVGFPNVGKSALINRLLNKRVCESAPKPGVTRNLKWLRLGGDLDLLDAPGEFCICLC